ncbi:MAG: hypothetical protein IPJ77_16645 [Planctomycetes bacterium]|nr:hypothetical protein [Planctomycetota bacterium]
MNPNRIEPNATRGGERLTALELALLLACVLGCRLLAMRACPVYDDAFITYRYAKNLAEGAGMVFNPGAAWEPVLWTTTPLYGFVLGMLAHLPFDLVDVSRALNIACDVASAALIARAFGLRRLPATLGVLAFAAFPELARISVGGMEAPVFALLALAASSLLFAGRVAWAGVFAALACTVRPEGVLLVGVCGLELLRRPRALLAFGVPVAAIGLATIAILNRAYGFPIPQSVLAKSHMKAGAWERVEPILSQSFAPHALMWIAFPIALLGFVELLRRPGPLRSFVAFGLAITASYLTARPHVWGWYFYVPLASTLLALAAGCEVVFERWLRARASWIELRAPRVFAPVALAGVAIVSLSWPTPVTSRVYAPMHAWARAVSAREPEARILASDIGAIGWAWDGTVLDSEGLTWPPALDYPHPNAIIRQWKPEYLLVVAERDRVAPLYADTELLAQYEPIERFSPSGARELVPALETLPSQWAQDYLVYRRRDVAPR